MRPNWSRRYCVFGTGSAAGSKDLNAPGSRVLLGAGVERSWGTKYLLKYWISEPDAYWGPKSSNYARRRLAYSNLCHMYRVLGFSIQCVCRTELQYFMHFDVMTYFG